MKKSLVLLGLTILTTICIPTLPTQPQKYPIVYRDEYNIGYGGVVGSLLRKLHPFDGTKYRRIAKSVSTALNMDIDAQWYKPEGPLTEAQKRTVHTPEYLASLKKSSTISQAIDCDYFLAWLPNSFLQKLVLRPMEWAAAGTVLAVELALKHGWAINLGAGYHHAAPSKGEGGCIFSDVPIALQLLWQKRPDINVLIIDLDAHQGNGFEKALSNDFRVVYFDVFNPDAGLADDKLIKASNNIVARPLVGGHLSSKIWGITFPEVFERCVDQDLRSSWRITNGSFS